MGPHLVVLDGLDHLWPEHLQLERWIVERKKGTDHARKQEDCSAGNHEAEILSNTAGHVSVKKRIGAKGLRVRRYR